MIGAGGKGLLRKRRLAIIVSHPIQYYVPLYRALALRDDVKIRVFFTWHAGGQSVLDRGFKRAFAWDIPLTEGYRHELVPNVSADPGTHRFWGLRNPSLIARVRAWHPDAVHVTGYAYESHLRAMRAFGRWTESSVDERGCDRRPLMNAVLLLQSLALGLGVTVGEIGRAHV